MERLQREIEQLSLTAREPYRVLVRMKALEPPPIVASILLTAEPLGVPEPQGAHP